MNKVVAICLMSGILGLVVFVLAVIFDTIVLRIICASAFILFAVLAVVLAVWTTIKIWRDEL